MTLASSSRGNKRRSQPSVGTVPKYPALCRLLRQLGYHIELEYRFCPARRWRSDLFVHPDILVEIEGGAWIAGRHTRGSGYLKDMEKYNAAVCLGYRLIRTTPSQCMNLPVILERLNPTRIKR